MELELTSRLACHKSCLDRIKDLSCYDTALPDADLARRRTSTRMDLSSLSCLAWGAFSSHAAKKKSASGLCSGHATQNFWPGVHFTCIRGSKAAAIINMPRLMFQHSCNHSNYNSSSSSTTITTSSNYRAVGVMKTTNYNRFKLLMQRINEHNK
jgi:hypothetical protein